MWARPSPRPPPGRTAGAPSYRWVGATTSLPESADESPAEVTIPIEPDSGAPRRRPSVSLIADLVRSGLAEGLVPLPTVPSLPSGPAAHAPVVVRTGERRSRRPAVAALVVVLVVLATVAVVVLLRR